MTADPWMRRRLNAIALHTERANLTTLLNAIANAAIRVYAGEAIVDAWPHITRAVAAYVRGAADLGAFRYFGVRDGGDLVHLPPVLFPGGYPGTIGAAMHHIASVIMNGGTRRVWVRPRDLDLSGAAR